MQMAMSTKVSGLMIKLTAKEPTHMQMELTIMEIGLTISSMVMAWSLGQTVQNMKVTMSTVKRKEKVSLPLPMAVFMKESLNKMKSVDTANIPGQMASNMKADGVTIKCMVKARLSGKTKRSIKAHSSTTSVKDSELLVGPMETNMLVNGKQANSMAKAPT